MRWVATGVTTVQLGLLLAAACSRSPVESAPTARPMSAPADAPGAAPSAPVSAAVSATSSVPPAASANAAPAVAEAGVLPGYRIDPAALIGCRAPDEPGCSTCCDKSDGGCERLSGLEDWGQYPGVEPWYNSRSVDCPRSCAPCARCTKRSERELAAQLPFSCDCANVQIGVDPCFSPGCACECSRRAYLVRACPAAPQ